MARLLAQGEEERVHRRAAEGGTGHQQVFVCSWRCDQRSCHRAGTHSIQVLHPRSPRVLSSLSPHVTQLPLLSSSKKQSLSSVQSINCAALQPAAMLCAACRWCAECITPSMLWLEMQLLACYARTQSPEHSFAALIKQS